MGSEDNEPQTGPEKKKKFPPVECPECRGKGEVWTAKHATGITQLGEALVRVSCPVCKGEGTVGRS